MQTLTLRYGDCVEVLRGYEEGSIGAIISDPPYDLALGTGSGGFMGKEWDSTGIAFSQRFWHEVYRVLRPGGIVKAFSGTRTFHRMVAAMGGVGFVGVRLEAWTYGSGFPKSLHIGMALEKASRGHPQGGPDPMKRGGDSRPPRNVLHLGGKDGKAPTGLSDTYGNRVLTTPDALRFRAWGTALKPSWEPVCVGRKPE